MKSAVRPGGRHTLLSFKDPTTWPARLAGDAQAVGWRVAAIQDYGFSSDVFRWMLENGRYPPEHLMRFVTYAFVHGGLTHAAFAVVILLAMGKFVGEILGDIALIAPARRATGAMARTDCELLRIGRTLFRRILTEYPETAVLLQERFARELQEMADQVAKLEDRFRD